MIKSKKNTIILLMIILGSSLSLYSVQAESRDTPNLTALIQKIYDGVRSNGNLINEKYDELVDLINGKHRTTDSLIMDATEKVDTLTTSENNHFIDDHSWHLNINNGINDVNSKQDTIIEHVDDVERAQADIIEEVDMRADAIEGKLETVVRMEIHADVFEIPADDTYYHFHYDQVRHISVTITGNYLVEDGDYISVWMTFPVTDAEHDANLLSKTCTIGKLTSAEDQNKAYTFEFDADCWKISGYKDEAGTNLPVGRFYATSTYIEYVEPS